MKPLQGPQPLSNLENLIFLFKNAFPQTPESIIVGHDACQIAMFREKIEKSESFKMSDFQRILVSKKGALKTCHPFSQPNCGNKSFQARSSDFKSTPIWGFLIVITNF